MTTIKKILSISFAKSRQIVLLVILLTSSTSVFGQNFDSDKEVLISSISTIAPKISNVSENNSMNLYSWFMGTK